MIQTYYHYYMSIWGKYLGNVAIMVKTLKEKYHFHFLKNPKDINDQSNHVM